MERNRPPRSRSPTTSRKSARPIADGKLRVYPGSPQIAFALLRPQDRLRLFELHSTEQKVLAGHFAGAGRRVTVTPGDGFAGVRAVLPPPSRRGLVLIDPSYETRDDYAKSSRRCTDGLQRFATGASRSGTRSCSDARRSACPRR